MNIYIYTYIYMHASGVGILLNGLSKEKLQYGNMRGFKEHSPLSAIHEGCACRFLCMHLSVHI